jgi:hypothetical protein
MGLTLVDAAHKLKLQHPDQTPVKARRHCGSYCEGRRPAPKKSIGSRHAPPDLKLTLL